MKKLTISMVAKQLQDDGYVHINNNKISYYGHDGFVVESHDGSFFTIDKNFAINAFIASVNSIER